LEPTISVFELAKTVHDLDLSATEIGENAYTFWRILRARITLIRTTISLKKITVT
jgi:hypothetical protein